MIAAPSPIARRLGPLTAPSEEELVAAYPRDNVVGAMSGSAHNWQRKPAV